MRRCLLACPLALVACGAAPPTEPRLSPSAAAALETPLADPALFAPCPGWTGGPPENEADLLVAVEAEIAARERCNGQLRALRQIYGGGR